VRRAPAAELIEDRLEEGQGSNAARISNQLFVRFRESSVFHADEAISICCDVVIVRSQPVSDVRQLCLSETHAETLDIEDDAEELLI
jgi:hypothetical protein